MRIIKNTAEYRNFDTINENTADESYYKVGTFEKHVGKQFHYDILGQIFDTYILIRRDDELEIYDQHIIHERILYEELKDKFYNKETGVTAFIIASENGDYRN